MSYREKVTWAGLVVMGLVWGVYFARMIGDVLGGALGAKAFVEASAGRFVQALVCVIVVEIILASVIALTTPEAEQTVRDERERLAVLRSDSFAFGVLGVLLVTLSIGVYALGIGTTLAPVLAEVQRVAGSGLVLAANGMLLCLLLADILRYAVRLWLLRAPF